MEKVTRTQFASSSTSQALAQVPLHHRQAYWAREVTLLKCTPGAGGRPRGGRGGGRPLKRGPLGGHQGGPPKRCKREVQVLLYEQCSVT